MAATLDHRASALSPRSWRRQIAARLGRQPRRAHKWRCGVEMTALVIPAGAAL